MTPVWGLDAAVAAFVAERLEAPRGFGECRGLAVINATRRMVAGLVFHNWEPVAGVIEVSAAADDPAWATRDVLRTAFGYAFGTAGCQLVVARTHENNGRVRRLWRSFGADEYVIPRLRGRTASEAIMTVTQEAWHASRFMRSEDGQGKRANAA